MYRRRGSVRGLRTLIFIAFAICWGPAATAQADPQLARIGILAHRGAEAATAYWDPLAAYLDASIDGWRFELRPVTLVSAAEEIAGQQIDFLITNPGHYVALAEDFPLSAIATRERLVAETASGLLTYGTVVVVRSDAGLHTLAELRGKSLAAVSPEAFGGFQVAWREMTDQGIDPFADLAALRFMGFPQDAIVDAVAGGDVDAGVVRSGLIESLDAEGRIDARNFEILGSRSQPGYPFRVTGHLYPEWPFVALPGTNKVLKDKVAVALLQTQAPGMTARFGLQDAWSAPLSYESVRHLIAAYEARDSGRAGTTPSLVYTALALAFALGLIVAFAGRQRSRPARPAGSRTPEAAAGAAGAGIDPCLALARERFERLTPREREILSRICSGQPTKTIASDLGVSPKTVEYHRSNLLRKTDAGSTAHLVQLATRLGFDLGFSPVENRP